MICTLYLQLMKLMDFILKWVKIYTSKLEVKYIAANFISWRQNLLRKYWVPKTNLATWSILHRFQGEFMKKLSLLKPIFAYFKVHCLLSMWFILCYWEKVYQILIIKWLSVGLTSIIIEY